MKAVSRVVVLVFALLVGCGPAPSRGGGAAGNDGVTAAAPSPITSVCAVVADADVAGAFGVSGWHGQNIGPVGHDLTDYRCEFRGSGYQLEVATTALPARISSADDALRSTLSILPGEPLDRDGELVDGVGERAVYAASPEALLLMGLTAVKRTGNGWRTLRVAGYDTPAGGDQPAKLPKDAVVALAKKIIAKL